MKNNILQRHVEQVKRIKQSIHAKTIDKLVSRLASSGMYSRVRTNIEYKIPGCSDVLGEIDVYAIRKVPRLKSGSVQTNHYLLLFEVKSNDSLNLRMTALKQLDKHETILSDNADKVFKFYVTPQKIEWIHKSKPTYHYLRP